MLKLTDKNECEWFDDPFCLAGLQTGDDAKISCYAIYLVGDTWRALLLFFIFHIHFDCSFYAFEYTARRRLLEGVSQWSNLKQKMGRHSENRCTLYNTYGSIYF